MKARISKIVIFLGVIATQALLAPLAYSYCLVSTQDSRGGNIYGLPYAVNPLYQGSSAELASCSTANDSLDDWLGFEQAIRFATSEAGYSNNNVNVITLRNPLVFDNPAVNVVVGNWPYLLPVASAYDYLYPINYDPDEVLTRADYGIVTLNGRANFDSEERSLVCAEGTDDVILRNLIINTNGITREEFFDQTGDESSCLKDGGSVYVCPGLIEGNPHTTPAAMNTWCDADADYKTVAEGDCNDNPDTGYAIHPGATEVCDGIDNDCQGGVDEGVLETFYVDLDGDGYGGEAVTACTQPEGTVTTAGDCDDIDELINPVAPEACIDGLDNDCDEDTDEDCECNADDVRPCGSDVGACVAGTETCAVDGLTWGACTGSIGSSPEICGNGIDEDCTGADLVCPPPDPLEVDNDGDGFCEGLDADGDCDGTPGAVDGDCNDLNASIKPGAVEICGDGVDNNCDGADEACPADPLEVDNDGDGFCEGLDADGDCDGTPGATSGDCHDDNAAISPGATEMCGDGIDNDCDGADVGDCPDPDNEDNDGDGFTENEGDCDDANAAVNPNATDTCENGVDEDCSGADLECPPPPETCPNGLPPRTWYLDADGDTYGTSSTSVEACDAPQDYVSQKTDCDDGDIEINPAAVEICNDSKDNDCDGRTNEGCAGQGDEDDDDDGFCESLVSCDDGSDTGDCDDTNPMINPGTEENCGDGTDNNCDGAADINDLQCQVEEPPPDDPPVVGEDGLLICPIPGNALNLCPLQGGSLFGGCSLIAVNNSTRAAPIVLMFFVIVGLTGALRFRSKNK